MELQTFIFIGRSGCGKGTQWRCFRNILRSKIISGHIFYIETGERFRQFIKEHSLSSRLPPEIYKTGNRPAQIFNWLCGCGQHLLVEKMTGEEHVIFDGNASFFHEAQIIDTAVTFNNRQRPHVIY